MDDDLPEIVEPASDRIVIQVVMRNSFKNLQLYQGIEESTKSFSIITHVKLFLLITSLFSGCFVSIFLSHGKLVQEFMKNSDGIGEALKNPLFYILQINTFLGMFINFYNLNITMSKYSQLYVMPFYESCSMFFNLITGIMLIGEGELYTNSQLTKIFIGNIVCITGIFLKMSTLEAYEPITGPVQSS